MIPWLVLTPCAAGEPDRVEVVMPHLAPGSPADGEALMRMFGPGTGFVLRAKSAVQVELVATLLIDNAPAQAWHSVPFSLRPGVRVHVSQALPLHDLPLDEGWTIARAEPVASWRTAPAPTQKAWLLITALPAVSGPIEVGTAVVRLERQAPQPALD